MKLLDSISVEHQGMTRQVLLYRGDLAAIPAEEAVDVLVVSAFPHDYTPTSTSLIGALAARGVSVEELAEDKEVDLRQFSACWLSRPVGQPDAGFHRILCFEPRFRGRANEVVGDIFRSIIPFTTGQPPIRQIALPIVASGDQGEPAAVMLEALVDAAVHWLSIGLPLECIKIMRGTAGTRRSCGKPSGRGRSGPSPRRAGGTSRPPASMRSSATRTRTGSRSMIWYSSCAAVGLQLRVFQDRLELNAGAAWRQHIFEALEDCRKVVCVFSPPYLESKVCKEELHVAWMRHRDSPEPVLLPIYLHSANLPYHLRLFQYLDAREGDPQQIATIARELADSL